MSNTPYLNINYIAQNQAQKEVNINEGFQKIDSAIESLSKNNSYTQSKYDVDIIVSESGELILNNGSSHVSVSKTLDKGVYELTMGDSKSFIQQKQLFVFPLSNLEQEIIICNAVFNDGKLKVITRKYLDGKFQKENCSFSLRYN